MENAGSMGDTEAEVSGGGGGSREVSLFDVVMVRLGRSGSEAWEYGCSSMFLRGSLRKLARTILELGWESAVRGVLRLSTAKDLAKAAHGKNHTSVSQSQAKIREN